MHFIFWLSLAVWCISLFGAITLALGSRKLGFLRDVASAPSDWPRVSVIIPALNEAATMERALCSVLALDYPQLEIIAINDRSTDATGEILQRIGSADPRVRVMHIQNLPAGWLGKNHALHQGAALATGEYILFTDADVVYAPTALRLAVAHSLAQRLDLLCVAPELPAKGLLLSMMTLGGIVVGFSIMKPWLVRSSATHFFGVGAFNMVRTQAYRTVGGHGAIPLAVVDDMLLAKLMKQPGMRHDVLLGNGMVEVEIYHSVPELVRGMRKNNFAALGYKVVNLLAATLAILLLVLLPLVGAVATDGATRWLNVATLVTNMALHWDAIRLTRYSRWCLIFQPINGLIGLFILWQASLIVLLRGEVEWRGTRYALSELRRAQLPVKP